ncbi:flagellar basal body L-ring protein FlgH [Erythrobacter sp. W53]|uniref:flagellar basal body L-ring protein FlgH n=1 Tax=Erythrobacteraceae TaxID=335929 RepID=UPI0036D3E3CB
MKAFRNQILATGITALIAAPAAADQLYKGDRWAGVASDNKASQVGDIVTIIIFETASATNRVGTRSGKDTSLNGGFSAGSVDESLSLGFDSSYRGIGETERSDRFVASMAAQVVEVLPNGDLLVVGQQNMLVNGEKRDIQIRGQVRAVDVSPNNTVASSRLANAQINYDGKGYVTRSAKPGLINRIFSFLGIG